MNVFIRAIVRIFSFGERLIVPFNEASLSPHENIFACALINIHSLYYIQDANFGVKNSMA